MSLWVLQKSLGSVAYIDFTLIHIPAVLQLLLVCEAYFPCEVMLQMMLYNTTYSWYLQMSKCLYVQYNVLVKHRI